MRRGGSGGGYPQGRQQGNRLSACSSSRTGGSAGSQSLSTLVREPLSQLATYQSAGSRALQLSVTHMCDLKKLNTVHTHTKKLYKAVKRSSPQADMQSWTSSAVRQEQRKPGVQRKRRAEEEEEEEGREGEGGAYNYSTTLTSE